MGRAEPPRWKRIAKAVAAKAEVPFGLVTVVLYGFAVVATLWLRPHITSGILAFILLFCGFTASTQAFFASLKSSDDPEE